MTKNNEHNNQKNKRSLSKHTRNLTLVLCMGMLAGVLIWAKLRLVTDIPRSAYADPKEAQILEPDADQDGQDQAEQQIKSSPEDQIKHADHSEDEHHDSESSSP